MCSIGYLPHDVQPHRAAVRSDDRPGRFHAPTAAAVHSHNSSWPSGTRLHRQSLAAGTSYHYTAPLAPPPPPHLPHDDAGPLHRTSPACCDSPCAAALGWRSPFYAVDFAEDSAAEWPLVGASYGPHSRTLVTPCHLHRRANLASRAAWAVEWRRRAERAAEQRGNWRDSGLDWSAQSALQSPRRWCGATRAARGWRQFWPLRRRR